jgi:predicted dinucleotide-binding enzyme
MTTITIIGTGSMGAAIAARIAKAGHTAEVVGRDPAKARALADRLVGAATTGTYGAVPAGDLVILAVPYGSAAAVLLDYGAALEAKIIIDVSNPVAPDLSGLVTAPGTSGAQEIAKGAPAGAHVVKAFNTLFGHVLAREGRRDVFIAADDAAAKARVSSFIESLGLRAFDVGELRMAQSLESLGWLMINLARNGAGTWNFALEVDLIA